MTEGQEKYSLIKETLITVIGGGSLGLLVLVGVELLVAFLKKMTGAEHVAASLVVDEPITAFRG